MREASKLAQIASRRLQQEDCFERRSGLDQSRCSFHRQTREMRLSSSVPQPVRRLVKSELNRSIDDEDFLIDENPDFGRECPKKRLLHVGI